MKSSWEHVIMDENDKVEEHKILYIPIVRWIMRRIWFHRLWVTHRICK